MVLRKVFLIFFFFISVFSLFPGAEPGEYVPSFHNNISKPRIRNIEDVKIPDMNTSYSFYSSLLDDNHLLTEFHENWNERGSVTLYYYDQKNRMTSLRREFNDGVISLCEFIYNNRDKLIRQTTSVIYNDSAGHEENDSFIEEFIWQNGMIKEWTSYSCEQAV